MHLDVAFIWAVILAFAVLAYVLLDGFDLGIGIISPLLGSPEAQRTAMASIAPVWDGNETWLVLGGGGLFAVFPLAYAILLPALYPLMIAMLLGLIFRGVAFEFIAQAQRLKRAWQWGFFAGSLIATLAQGIALGAIIQGIQVANRAYAGGNWDWLTPFSILTGIALIVGYALLGATWLIYKTDEALQARAQQLARPLAILLIGFILGISLLTPLLQPQYLERWFGWPQSLYTAIVPLLCLGSIYLLFRGLSTQHNSQPFIATQALFILCYIGLQISLYPHLVPPFINFRQAAAPSSSLTFLLVGTMFLIPLILLYTGYSYWVFRGKVKQGEGYH